jgi:hypothetical protein
LPVTLIEFSEAGIAEPQRVDEARNAALKELDSRIYLFPRDTLQP